MRVLALDIGNVRTGIAVSDVLQKIATPVCVLPSNEVASNAKSFKRVLEEYEPGLLVCGLPRSLSGEEGKQAKDVRQIVEKISRTCEIPYVFADERLTSREAKQALRDMGYDEKKMRGKVDMIAASLFLQTWLDANSPKDEGPDEE